jgi:hypothetical protein
VAQVVVMGWKLGECVQEREAKAKEGMERRRGAAQPAKDARSLLIPRQRK